MDFLLILALSSLLLLTLLAVPALAEHFPGERACDVGLKKFFGGENPGRGLEKMPPNNGEQSEMDLAGELVDDYERACHLK